MTKKELVAYFEHVRYQVACFLRNSKSPLPQFSGSGFILDFEGHKIFVTAGHVATSHHDGAFSDDKLLTIQTNTICQDEGTGQAGCILVTVGGVVSTTAHRVDMATGDIRTIGVVDVSFAQLDSTRTNAPFVTQRITIEGANVQYREPKQCISYDDVIEVNHEDEYSVFGRVHLSFGNSNGQHILNSEVIFHTGLKYTGTIRDMVVLKYGKPVVVADWKGLSGSPVLNQDGKLIGVACSVDPIANTLHVMPIQKIKPLIQAEILNCQ